MITGRFGNTTAAPYVEGRLILPGLGIEGNISFLIDTGADVTTIMPDDSQKLRVDFHSLTNPDIATGIGGNATTFEEDAHLTFFEANTNKLSLYATPVQFITPSSYTAGIPSLLGRDVLDRWRMVYGPSKNILTFTVRSADLTA